MVSGITASRNPLFAAFRLSSDMFFQAAHYRNRYRTGTATSSTGRNGTRRQVPYWQADCPGTPGMRQKTHRCPGATAVPAPDQMRFFTPDLCPQYTYRTAPQFTQPCYRPYRLSDRKSSVTAITVRIPAVTVSAIHSPLAGSPAAAESTATATEPTGKSGTSTTTKSGTSTGRT